MEVRKKRPSFGFLLFCLVGLFETSKAVNNNPLTQPQILVENGNIYFIPAENRNLVLQTNGRGNILLNSMSLQNLTNAVQNSVRDLNAFKTVFGNPSSSSGPVSSRIATLEQTMQRLSQIEQLDGRLTVLEQRILSSNASSSDVADYTRLQSRLRRLRNRVEALETRLSGVGSSTTNPCSSSPCSNGATCIPTIYGVFCQCPSGWEGPRCADDVNECALFTGTELGCQNGATCVNRPGSWHCQCASGYVGQHCTKRSGDCSSASAWELCGHGICINQHSGPSPFTCLCDAGWTKDSRSPACTQDVDECSQYHTSCSTNPPVHCINTPGSYVCGPCPFGYTGNGYQCSDVNECLVNNGGCSQNPLVPCTNTPGSRTCGPCPPGYMGNGVICQYVGVCQINNGGCHPLARCVDNPVISQSFVQCVCPAGYTGTGMGLNGCMQYGGGGGGSVGPVQPSSGNPCVPSPCQNGGVCHSFGSAFTCTCFQGYGGPTCATRLDPCASSPCQNGGTCHASTLSPAGYQCTCSSQYTGDLCEQQSESCGGSMVAEEGSIRFPQTQSSYDPNTRCEWELHTTEGRVFNLTFTQFHLEGSSNCRYDYLEIRDGTDLGSPLLGRYCGEELPGGGTLISTHNSLRIIFRSDHNIVGLGFAFTWNSTAPTCGGLLSNQTHGSFSSPGYPGPYPHDRDCFWQIEAALGKRLQLTFATFRIENHTDCNFDYVEVRDGLEESAPVLEKLCSTTLPAPVTSSGPYLSVRFHSDDSHADQGFLATYNQVPGVPGCGGVLTEANAVFSSPQHPQPYAHGLECDWLIRLSSRDERISLRFLTFELESSYHNCMYDYVEVHDGPSIESPLVGRFCGVQIPPSFTSTRNQLFVRFKSDESVAMGGFSAKYEAVCGGEFTTPSGILRSPYYPANYPNHRQCVYVISLPAGNGITLQFQDFDIESGLTDTNCYFDYLEIRDGDNENSTLLGHYCGPQAAGPELITSTHNYLWLRFKTDGSIQNRGFMANYTSYETGCGGILRGGEGGTLSSPGHPEVYPHGVVCRWILRGDPGQIVRLTWDTFSLEASSTCRWDYIEIYDNSTSFVNGSLVGRWCGQDTPPQVTSTDTTLTVIFRSDHSAAFDGFMATYKFLNASTACGGNFFTEYGQIKSPRYPELYPNSRTCTWVVTAPRGRQIELNVTDFDMEEGSSAGCRYDFLEIRNGPHPTSPLIGKFCGNRPPPTRIPSFSNSLFVKFRSDSSHRRRGFNILWDATSTGCGGNLVAPSGSITSPNYPSPYGGGGIECMWKITVNQGSSLMLTFVDIDVQHSAASSSASCWGEYVQVFDGPTRNSPSLGKFCAEDHAVSIQTSGNTVTIKFLVSVFGGNGRGFQLNYRTNCNRVLRGFEGVIESPNFPNPYPHNRNCTWRIEAPRGNKVNVSFSHFEVEGPFRGNCSYDFVQISEWKRNGVSRTGPEGSEGVANKTVLGTYCGTSKPGLVSSTLDTLAVTFVSDYSHAGNGFRLEWRQYGCGGRIIGDFGVLKSPGYPRRYIHNVECVWQVTTELGSRVQLTVYDLDVERGVNCLFDGLVVYGGPDDKSPLLTKLCETVSSTPTVLHSQGNNMFIRFYSDDTISGKGFYGYVQEISGGCGGVLRGTNGYLYSPNYPQRYDHNDDCTWLINVDGNHVVELTWEEFDVERHINCSYDHVAVYDGGSTQAPLLQMHCGNDLPSPQIVRSTGSQMLIRLKTDGSAAGKGFKARYQRGCGARLVDRNWGVITTPNFPAPMSPADSMANCSWIIEGRNTDDRVSLTFTYMDLSMGGDDTNCTRNYIEVLDGDDYEAPSLYKACSGGIPPTLTSRGNSMLLHIIGDHYHGHGFRAVYDLSSGACGGRLTAANGSLTSPNYPRGYPPNVECIWTIRAAPGNQVQLSFRNFDIETSDFCNTDFVEIHEDSAQGPLLGHFCGNQVPSNVTAAEQLWILFRSDAEGQAPGFWADYTLVHGVDLSGASGSIGSPMYPQSFSGTGTFTWRVTVNDSYAVQLSFIDYDLVVYADSDDCEYTDKITIYDGYDENAPVLLRVCSRDKPEPVTSTGNTIFIQYYRINWFASWLVQWQQVQPISGLENITRNVQGCGGNFSLSGINDTTLVSPGYPNGYPPNLECEWNFDAPPNSRIKLLVNWMGLESHTNCIYDYVELYDGVEGLPNFHLNKTICQHTEVGNTYLSSGRYLRVKLKTDRSVWGPGFNFSLSTECGGYVRDARGIISSPNYPNNYVAANCKWIVIVKPARTIRITFNSNFEIYSAGGQCVTDKLLLRNGGSENSPFLGSGRFCGQTAPAPLETSGNHLLVHFVSWTHGGKGFAMTYEEVSLGCGGNLQLSDAAPQTIINSPNFPAAIPPPFTECEWIVSAPQGEAVQVTFQNSFEFFYSPGCQQAGLEVRDGGTAIAPNLGVFCREMPGTLTSTGNVLYLRYYTNVIEPRKGFKAEVKIATCGGIHASRVGTISSPGYPATYETGLDCTWTIRAPRGSNLILEFQNFNLGGSLDANCTQSGDNLTIQEQSGLEADMPLRNWTFCGPGDSLLPNRIQTASNEITVRFRSDANRERQTSGIGFKLRYRVRQQYCGGNLRTPTGYIQSPGYPQSYPHYVYCVWRVYAPAGRRIRIEFTDFDMEEPVALEPGGKRGCSFDRLWIYQGVFRAVRSPLYNQSLCGGHTPDPVESTSTEVTLYFRTDGSIAHRGFKLHYTTELPVVCGGILSLGADNVTSPNGTTNTPATTTNVLCEWKTGEDLSYYNGTTIVTINSLRIPSWGVKDPLCSYGFLKVSPLSLISQYKWRKLCGELTNEKLYLPGNSLLVEYVSEDTNASFSLSYRNVACGGRLYGPDENVTSPNYPNAYPTATECIWMVEFPRGGQVKVQFMDMDMSDHQSDGACDKDYVIVRNGKYPSSPVLGRFCGSYVPQIMTSMSNELWIEFHSSGDTSSQSRRGFHLHLEPVMRGCGGTIHRKYGQLASPTLDSTTRRYPHNTECEWIIESVPGYTVNLVFFDRFDIENSTDCQNDNVEIFSREGGEEGLWESLGRYCGRAVPAAVNTTTNSVKVLFRSNDNNNGDGFRLYWYSPCGGVFHQKSGIIRSAHYDEFAHSQHVNPGRFWSFQGWESNYRVYHCDYEIQGNPDDYVMVQFLPPFEVQVPQAQSVFALSDAELNQHCPRLNVSVWQGNASVIQRFQGPYCGRDVPPPFIARGSAMICYFYQPNYENYGWKVKFARFECGGEITTPATISSPGHPFTSASNMNCTWVIRAPPNKVVRFKFQFLEMEFHSQCSWDSVRLYDGALIDDTKIIGTYCGNMTADEDLPSIFGKTGVLTVVSITDHIIEHGGFSAAVDFTWGEAQGCGGLKNLTLGPATISSVDADGNGKYEDNLDCQWLLVAGEFRAIEVTFSTFVLEGSGAAGKMNNRSTDCAFDYLEFRDGPGAHAPLLQRLCGSGTLPAPLLSSQNFLWVRFVTDGSTNFAGFSFTARNRETPCGTLVFNATNTMQYLTSPGYPNNYDNNVRCRWRIDGSSFYDEVDITFVDLDIPSTPGCTGDRLEISDVASTVRTPEGISGPILYTGTGPVDWRYRNLNLNMSDILKDLKYCGRQTPPDFFTVGRSAEVVFHTDATGTAKGFKIGFKAAQCNRTYENTQGRIYSPEWPGYTPIFSNCLSAIRAPNGSTVALYFNSFSLPLASSDSGGCTESAVEVREATPTGPVLAQYCGDSIPSPVFSNGSVVYLKFFNRMHPARGYDITYTTTALGRGCGGEIFHTGGSFTSPLYPFTGNSSQEQDCAWRIRVPAALRVQIQFTNFQFAGSCETDFVEISTLDSHDINASPTLFSRFCGNDAPSVFTSPTDMALVRYKSSANNTGVGWRATFKGVYPTSVPISSQ